jgi:hypothetical protein
VWPETTSLSTGLCRLAWGVGPAKARTAYWVEWWRRFGPPSGNDPKLQDPFGRYVLTTSAKGTNMGPYEAARHIPGGSGHELAYEANRRFSLVLLNEAIADLVNAHARLDISQA